MEVIQPVDPVQFGLTCASCKASKLSDEFPEFLSTVCEHPPTCCVRCCVKAIHKNGAVCPLCSRNIQPREQEMLGNLLRRVAGVFEDPACKPCQVQAKEHGRAANIALTVSLLDGTSLTMNALPTTTVDQLKHMISQQLKVVPGKQRLLYRGKELQNCMADGVPTTLAAYSIPSGATIQLIVLMLEIAHGSNLKHVTFDLVWGYPRDKDIDFLDGSCLMYVTKPKLTWQVVDFNHVVQPGVMHSGDVMDNKARIGHHVIEVSLDEISENVNELIFCLSAWDSPTIGAFNRPRVRLFDKDKPNSPELASYVFEKAANSQGVVMCMLCRERDKWTVKACGVLSDGNAKNYQPLVKTWWSIRERM